MRDKICNVILRYNTISPSRQARNAFLGDSAALAGVPVIHISSTEHYACDVSHRKTQCHNLINTL
ncbi:hypothetical protein PGO12_09550 [Klebsiella aerogenes]